MKPKNGSKEPVGSFFVLKCVPKIHSAFCKPYFARYFALIRLTLAGGRFPGEKECGTDGNDASGELCSKKRDNKIRVSSERKSHMGSDSRGSGDEKGSVCDLSAIIHFFHHRD